MNQEQKDAERKLQRKADNFVRREVFYNLGGWMDFAMAAYYATDGEIQDKCPVDVEEIPSTQVCEDCRGTGYEVYEDETGEPYADLKEILKETGADADGLGWEEDEDGEYIAVNHFEECPNCTDGEIEVEIYEWWAVSSYLAGKLEAAGEVVLEGEIWGRQCTGQAISMDGVIRGFAAELGDAWAE